MADALDGVLQRLQRRVEPGQDDQRHDQVLGPGVENEQAEQNGQGGDPARFGLQQQPGQGISAGKSTVFPGDPGRRRARRRMEKAARLAKTPVVTLEFALRQLPRPGDADGRKTGVTRPPDSRR